MDDINTNFDEFNTDLYEIEINDDVILGVEKDCELERNPKVSSGKDKKIKVILGLILKIKIYKYEQIECSNSVWGDSVWGDSVWGDFVWDDFVWGDSVRDDCVWDDSDLWNALK